MIDNSSCLLSLKNICKSFTIDLGRHKSELKVLNGVNLKVNRGESLAVTGPSGSGKSTLIHIMGGLERPTKGKVLFEAADIYSLNNRELDIYKNRKIGFIFQFHYLLDDFSALENVAIPALLGGGKLSEATKRAEALLVQVGLKDRLHHLPKELSGGEQQRTALARSLMNNPLILFADEPTGSLDRQNSEIVQELILSLPKSGVAIVVVTHDMELASKAEKILHLEKE
ncbi:MAG: ABC transporter ATP-binding protein [Deferribacteraceae bacterium]|jgi:lipoprotein-releasing system ATP-binding protein|nr:ABC transporter ATP-binding protein [Deferribacteraceae bacterium]